MEKNEIPTIDVTGRGIVTVDLDTTRIELKVVECGSGYGECYARAAAIEKRVGEMVGELFHHTKVQTVDMSVKEGDSQDCPAECYCLNLLLLIEMDINRKLLSRLVRKIGEEIPVENMKICYTVWEPRSVQFRLLDRAARDTKDRAIKLASAIGYAPDRLVRMNSELHDVSICSRVFEIHSAVEAQNCSEASLDFSSVQISVSDTVTATWALTRKPEKKKNDTVSDSAQVPA